MNYHSANTYAITQVNYNIARTQEAPLISPSNDFSLPLPPSEVTTVQVIKEVIRLSGPNSCQPKKAN